MYSGFTYKHEKSLEEHYGGATGMSNNNKFIVRGKKNINGRFVIVIFLYILTHRLSSI